MSTPAPGVIEALAERLRVVQAVSQLNARRLLGQQACGGAEFDILRVEREIAAEGEAEHRGAALREAQARRRRAEAAMAACDAELAALDLRLRELDRRIAG
ncbi:hypothetical protein [Labrys wisconsinensis]|uniref:Uncharacterized protein n=1 Tax=Labrys wisconsinensis TaxID=425677 RepID=A0ABU0JLD1_9HYPH|nr:hypothetical protein [Labrys wisconsinensis]MDQ0475099.1 hypothetical protein [Labrys wisconsinensis]